MSFIFVSRSTIESDTLGSLNPALVVDVQQCRRILGLVISPVAFCTISLIARPILQQSSAGLQREEVGLQADLRSLRCASEIISGIAVTSVHRKPQVERVTCPLTSCIWHLICIFRLLMVLLVQL